MNIEVSPSSLKGKIKAIDSKSYVHRLLIAAALSDKKHIIETSLRSEDILATVNCLNALGAEITCNEREITVIPVKTPPLKAELNCNESGSTYRFMVPLAAALGVETLFILKGKLPKRPMDPMWEVLESHGVTVSGKGSPKVKIKGKLKGDFFTIRGDISSQYITGLLFSLPLLENNSKISISTELSSVGYINMTIEILKLFNIFPILENNVFTIKSSAYEYFHNSVYIKSEGDWSNSSTFLCAGLMSKEGITVEGLNPHSSQMDKEIINIIKDFNGNISINENAFTVKKSEDLKAVTINGENIPDLIPVLSAAAASIKGTTVFTNIERLKYKESDRIKAICETITSLKGIAYYKDEKLYIEGKGFLQGGRVSSFNDHRIVMMSAILAAICKEPVIIENAEAVNKSYPRFFTDLKALGATMKEENL